MHQYQEQEQQLRLRLCCCAQTLHGRTCLACPQHRGVLRSAWPCILSLHKRCLRLVGPHFAIALLLCWPLYTACPDQGLAYSALNALRRAGMGRSEMTSCMHANAAKNRGRADLSLTGESSCDTWGILHDASQDLHKQLCGMLKTTCHLH